MGKPVAIEDRAVYKVQAYLTKKDYNALEKYCDKKKESISAIVASIIKECLAIH